MPRMGASEAATFWQAVSFSAAFLLLLIFLGCSSTVSAEPLCARISPLQSKIDPRLALTAVSRVHWLRARSTSSGPCMI